MTPAAPLRPRVTTTLTHTYRQWLDDEFGPGMKTAHAAMDAPDPVHAHHAQTYYAAAVDRRYPNTQIFEVPEVPHGRTRRERYAAAITGLVGFPVLWFGANDILAAIGVIT